MYFTVKCIFVIRISGFVLIFSLMGILHSCQSSRTSARSGDRVNSTKSYPLRVSFQPDYVEVQQTEFVALWDLDRHSQPRGGRINTSGDGYFLTLKNNTINADLPYYGQRYEFLGVYEEPRIRIKDKSLENVTYGRTADRKIVSLEFDVLQIAERFHVKLVIQHDKKAYLLIFSPHRQSIRYDGRVEVL